LRGLQPAVADIFVGMHKPHHVHIVEDDPRLRALIAEYLEAQGLDVTPLHSAEEWLALLPRRRPDLAVLDITLPGMSGLQACLQLRAQGDRVPIVFLTARSEEIDRVMGLEMGGDDYLSKPFSARELLARVHAVLRRSHASPSLRAPRPESVCFGHTVFDPLSRRVTVRGQKHRLSNAEFAILSELVAHPGAALSRERLLVSAHSRATAVTTRAIDVAIVRLRKKLEPNPGQPQFIQTLRGHGYMFVPPTASNSEDAE
jgi:two-component system, OmpR family, phosphate regulon response regulator OmpR